MKNNSLHAKPIICMISTDYIITQRFRQFFIKLQYNYFSILLTSDIEKNTFSLKPDIIFLHLSASLRLYENELLNILDSYSETPLFILKGSHIPSLEESLQSRNIKGTVNIPVKYLHAEEKIMTLLQQKNKANKFESSVLIIDKSNQQQNEPIKFLPEEVFASLSNVINTSSYKQAIDLIKKDGANISMILVNAENDYCTIEIARLLRISLQKSDIPVYFVADSINTYTYDNLTKLGFDNIIDKTEFNYDEIKNILVSHKQVTNVHESSAQYNNTRKQILNDIKLIKSLPPLPDIYFKIENLANDKKSTPSDFSNVIELDPGITTKILRMINSAHYGFSRKIDNLREAVSMMGINGIVSMVRLSCITGTLKIDKKAEQYVVQLWRHSAVCAISSQIIAQKSGIQLNKDDFDNMFICGIIHDIGKFIFLKFFSDLYVPILEKNTNNSILNYYEEEKYLGITHVEIGKYLAIHWGLPDFFSKIIRMHHTPEKNPTSEISSIIHVADIVSNCITSEDYYKKYLDNFEYDSSTGFNSEDIHNLVEEIGDDVKEKAKAVQEMIML